MRIALGPAIPLAIAVMIASAQPALADPPDAEDDPYRITSSGEIVTTSKMKLPRGDANSGPSPRTTTTTTLPGGVTAWSTSGLQWQESCCFRWVWGKTQSYTSQNIQEIEAHGALISDSASAPNCLEGTQHWTPDLVAYNTYLVDSGWGPGGGVQQFKGSRCWVMASGHYYIYNGARTDVSGPDTYKTF